MPREHIHIGELTDRHMELAEEKVQPIVEAMLWQSMGLMTDQEMAEVLYSNLDPIEPETLLAIIFMLGKAVTDDIEFIASKSNRTPIEIYEILYLGKEPEDGADR